MSIRLMNTVFEMDLEPKRKITLLVLADHADVNAYCFPGQGTLSRRTSIPERTLRRILESLEEDGLIRRERRTRSGGQRTSDGYDLSAILAGGPTGQNAGGNRPTVAGTGEPSGEPSGTDLTKTSQRQSRPIEPSVVTDPKLSPVEKAMAGRAGIVSIGPIMEVIAIHCQREVTASSALTLSLQILDRAMRAPAAPGRYVMAAIRKTPFEWQKYIDESGLT